MKEGELFTLPTDKASTDVLISRYLANLLGLKVGDSFLTYFVQDEVRARKFHITGIYETGFVDYDKLFVIADIRQIRRLNGWAPDEVSGLELQVADYDHLDRIAEDLYFDIAEKQDRNGKHILYPLHQRTESDDIRLVGGAGYQRGGDLGTDPGRCRLHHDFGAIDYYFGTDEHDRYFESFG